MHLQLYLQFLFFCGFLHFKSLVNSFVLGESCGKIGTTRGNTFGQNISYPWVAALMNNEGKAFCGGTLISKNKVLTAASCIYGKNNNYKFTASDIIVTLGAHNIRGRSSVDVDSIEIHSDWNIHTESFDADVAILTLTDNVNFNRYIQPICLINSNSQISRNTKGLSVSYGRTGYDEDDKNVLNKIEVPIVNNNEDCFYTNHYLMQLSSARTFCAGSRNGTGVCTGDSGNGLFIIHDNTFYLRGIVSSSLTTGSGCDLQNYAVFTNVPSFYGWIIDRINDEQSTTVKPTTTTTRGMFWRFTPTRTTTIERDSIVVTTTMKTIIQEATTRMPILQKNESCSHWYRFCKFGL